MSNEAPFLTSDRAATGMAGGARPVLFTVIMMTNITTRGRAVSG